MIDKNVDVTDHIWIDIAIWDIFEIIIWLTDININIYNSVNYLFNLLNIKNIYLNAYGAHIHIWKWLKLIEIYTLQWLDIWIYL